MKSEQLFSLGSAAKQCGDYVLANEVFAVLAHMAISRTADVLIGYEQDTARDDIVENLSNPDGSGYYDLPFVYDKSGNYLCIPLPLASRHYCNHIVWNCSQWRDREDGDHDRNHWRLGHDADRKDAASRDLRRRFENLVDDDYRQMAINVILRSEESDKEDTNAPSAIEMTPQWLGPATLAKLAIPFDYDYYMQEDEE